MLWFNKPTEIASPFQDNLYKLVLNLDALNPVIRVHVVQPSASLDHLYISSTKGKVLLNGVFFPSETNPLRRLGYKRILFLAELNPKETRGNDVIFNASKLRIYNPGAKRFDFLWFLSKFFPKVRRAIIQTITERIPLVVSTDEKKMELIFHTDYFISKAFTIGRTLGDIKILMVKSEYENRISFYVHSNLILINMVQTFGPEYLELEEIQPDKESQALLWEVFRS